MLVVIGIVVAFLVVAAVVDWRARRRGGKRASGKSYAASIEQRRRDVRARRSTMNLGGDNGTSDPYGDRRRR